MSRINMSKFDLSPEALDQGLTDEEVLDFTVKVDDFRDSVDTLNLATAEADQVRQLHAQWLSIGSELFQLASRIVGTQVVKETKAQVEKKITQTLQERLMATFGKLFGGSS